MGKLTVIFLSSYPQYIGVKKGVHMHFWEVAPYSESPLSEWVMSVTVLRVCEGIVGRYLSWDKQEGFLNLSMTFPSKRGAYLYFCVNSHLILRDTYLFTTKSS